MLNPAFWWLLAVKFLAFWKLLPRSWGTNTLLVPQPKSWGPISPGPYGCCAYEPVKLAVLGNCTCWFSACRRIRAVSSTYDLSVSPVSCGRRSHGRCLLTHRSNSCHPGFGDTGGFLWFTDCETVGQNKRQHFVCTDATRTWESARELRRINQCQERDFRDVGENGSRTGLKLSEQVQLAEKRAGSAVSCLQNFYAL